MGNNQGNIQDSLQDSFVPGMPYKAHSFLLQGIATYHTIDSKEIGENLEVAKPSCYHLLSRLNSALLKKIEIKAKSQESPQNASINLVALENVIQWQKEKESQSCTEKYPLFKKGSRQLFVQV